MDKKTILEILENNKNLRGADLRDADLTNADLTNADLRGAIHEFSICPQDGSFIGYKKCEGDRIVKLLILEDSKRLSATSRKCRADKVKVLDIYSLNDTSVKFKTAISKHDNSFVYEVGKIIEINNFDDDRWNGCSTGIHFFLYEEEAKRY